MGAHPARQGGRRYVASGARQKLGRLALPLPTFGATSPLVAGLSGRHYTFADNSLNARSASLTVGGDKALFRLNDARGTHQVRCGINRWVTGESTVSALPLKLVDTPVPGETRTRVAATGSWQDANTFVMTWRFIETAHYDTVTYRFDPADSLLVTFANNLSKLTKTADKRPVLLGTWQPGGSGRSSPIGSGSLVSNN